MNFKQPYSQSTMGRHHAGSEAGSNRSSTRFVSSKDGGQLRLVSDSLFCLDYSFIGLKENEVDSIFSLILAPATMKEPLLRILPLCRLLAAEL